MVFVLIPIVQCSSSASAFAKPWDVAPPHLAYSDKWNIATTASAFPAIYEEERRRAVMAAGGGQGHKHRIPGPLLEPNSRVILVCKVLVPREQAARAHARAVPSPSGPLSERSLPRFYEVRPYPQYTLPRLLVHLNDRNPLLGL